LKRDQSDRLLQLAYDLFPGAVNSPVRAFKAVGGEPIFIQKGEGPWILDVDGNRYIDYVLSWGPLVLGHADFGVVEAIATAARLGTSYGAPCPAEVELATLVRSLMPTMEMIRFVNSGTEATMSALRLARGFTRREKVIKFKGNYHGHSDMLLVQSGSGMGTLGVPDSPGVTRAAVADTLVAVYNDIDSVSSLFKEYSNRVAAVIVEPVAANMGLVLPKRGFLEKLRELTKKHGALLVFDEVLTGFRVHPGGAQAVFGIEPDLTTIGKVLGGGLPVGAYGGQRKIMEELAPAGPVYQAGTLSGNPLAMAAGIATLKGLMEEGTWDALEKSCQTLVTGLQEVASKCRVPVSVASIGSLFSVYFGGQSPHDWDSAAQGNGRHYARFFQAMLERSVYLAPSPFEVGFVSTKHTETILEETLESARASFALL
jgi:glutamate-1-semialdehyde 2,1-aminomutase